MNLVRKIWIHPSTFEYINNHGGFFNDDFRLFDTDNMSGELTINYSQWTSTFNDQQLNEINVTWGEKEFMTINVLFYVQVCL